MQMVSFFVIFNDPTQELVSLALTLNPIERTVFLGRVVQSPILLLQDRENFNFSIFIVCPSVLGLSNLKLHKR